MMRLPLLAGLCLLIPSLALAQSNVVVIPNVVARANPATGATIGTTHGTVVAAGTYGLVEIDNQSQTTGALVYCVWGGTAVAAATAGQTTIFPGGGFTWDASNPPPSGLVLDCVAAVAATPVTVRVW